MHVHPAPAPTPDPVPQQMAVAPAPAADDDSPEAVMAAAASHDKPSGKLPEPLNPDDAKDDNDDIKKHLPKPSVPPKLPDPGPHAPIGIIIATVLVMLILCGLAIAIYMSSSTSM